MLSVLARFDSIFRASLSKPETVWQVGSDRREYTSGLLGRSDFTFDFLIAVFFERFLAELWIDILLSNEFPNLTSIFE